MAPDWEFPQRALDILARHFCHFIERPKVSEVHINSFFVVSGLKLRLMQGMEARDWITLAGVVLISLPTLGVSIGTLWLTSKARNSIHRDQLYKKQIETYEKIFSLLTPMHHECINCTWKPEGELRGLDDLPTANDIRRNFSNRIFKTGAYDALFFAYQEAMFHLPTEFQEAMTAYLDIVMKVSIGLPKLEGDLSLQRQSMQQDLEVMYKGVIQAARHSIGAEKLSEEILSILNSPRRAL